MVVPSPAIPLAILQRSAYHVVESSPANQPFLLLKLEQRFFESEPLMENTNAQRDPMVPFTSSLVRETVFFIWLLILMSLPLIAATAQPTTFPSHRIFENPPAGCEAMTLTNVDLTANPNFGTVWPNVLVNRGTVVQLVGTAERQQRDAQCRVAYAALPFKWSATLQPASFVKSLDVTRKLVGTNALSPTLKTDEAGTYVVQLTTADSVAQVTIEVIEDGFRWVNIGPDGRSNKATGRINAIAFDKTRPGTIYVGAAQGGVWKSFDYGANWRPMTDNKGLPTLGIGALTVAPDGGAIYAGTGDPDGTGDNARPGRGIYKSVDGGITWTSAGGPASGCPTPLNGLVRRILIDPSNSALIYAATDTKVYRSGNGGQCWTPIEGSDPANSPQGTIFDLALVPGEPTSLYAVAQTSGVSLTRNARGSARNPLPTWSRLPVPAWATSTRPTVLRAGLAVSAASPAIVYAAFVFQVAGPSPCNSNPSNPGPTKRIVIYRSQDRGTSWTALPLPQELDLCSNSCQCHYNFALIANPTDENDIFHGDVALWRIKPSPIEPGNPWSSQDWSGPNKITFNARGQAIHGDVHALAFDPNNPSMLYEGDDGGLWRFNLSADSSIASTNWTSLNTNLAIGQFRRLGLDPNWPGDIAGGQQDNGTLRRLGGRTWSPIPEAGLDGWWASYDASRNLCNLPYPFPSPLCNYVYTNKNTGDNGEFFRYDLVNGYSNILSNVGVFRSDPFRPGTMVAISPVPNKPTGGGELYYGTNLNAASQASWTCIDPTPGNPNDNVNEVAFARVFPSGSGGVYYTGHSTGEIYLVDVQAAPGAFPVCGAGQSATRSVQLIYSPPTTAVNAPIIGLAEDPSRPCVLYAISALPATSSDPGYRVLQITGTPNSANGCAAPWNALPIAGSPSNPTGLPATVNNQPFSLHRGAVAADPSQLNLVYAGTDAGLFIGQRQGRPPRWQWSRSLDVPDTTITDIESHINSAGSFGTVYASTFGRGVFERVLTGPSRQAMNRMAQPQPIENAITRCQVREHGDSNRWRIAEVEVDYSYNGDHGQRVQLLPVIIADGVVSPHFIREIASITKSGKGTAILQLIYGAANAPLGLTTNGLRVEMSGEHGEFMFSRDCQLSKTWRRDGAYVIEIRAEDIALEGASADAIIPIKVSQSGRQSATHYTPFTLIVPKGTTITLEAPERRKQHDALRAFHQWSLYGREERSDSPQFIFKVSDDTSAVVRYVAAK